MPSKPQYVHDLITSVKLLEDQVRNLREESNDLGKKIDDLKETLDITRRDAAVTVKQVGEVRKRSDERENRWWGLILILIGALLSLASGLIVTLVRK